MIYTVSKKVIFTLTENPNNLGEKEPTGLELVHLPSVEFSKFFYWKIIGSSKHTDTIKQLWDHTLGTDLSKDDWIEVQTFPFRLISAMKLHVF